MNTSFISLLKTLLLFAFFLQVLSYPLNSQTFSSPTEKGYGSASYSKLKDNEFLKNWLLLGPVLVSDSAAKPASVHLQAFENDVITSVTVNPSQVLPGIKIKGTDYSWKMVKSDNPSINLISVMGEKEFAYAYALAEIKVKGDKKQLIGLGSDDGVKVFLNGKLIHQNWIGRGTVPDDDLVTLDLKKGSNQLLLKIQNMQRGWGFTLRPVTSDKLANIFVDGAGTGQFDKVKLIIEEGIDINTPNSIGLSAYQSAQLHGREKMANYLKTKGAKTDVPLPPFEKLADNIFSVIRNDVDPATTILVAQNGKIIYEKAFGYADCDKKIAANTETKFRIGSITKQFTACAILKLQEEGKINVHDTLSHYIPDFPRGNEVTIEHLLTHTSGIHSYTNRPAFINYVTQPITSQALVDTIKTYPYDFSPGERYQYNNSGFFILGYLIEKLAGKSYDAYLREAFFEPLGMKNTGCYSINNPLDNEALGFTMKDGKPEKALNWNMDWAGGAGALYSTVRDLYIWNEAVFGGKVISGKSLQAAFTPASLNNKEKVNYGFGWALDTLRGIQVISHGGGLHGFVSYLGRFPQKNITVTVLCNSAPSPSGINPQTNANLISEYLLWEQMDKRASNEIDSTVNPEMLESYTGRYNYGRGLILIVKSNGKQLTAQLTGQPEFPIFPAGNDEFFWKVAEARIKFIKDTNDNVIRATHFQNGRKFDVTKMADEEAVKIPFEAMNRIVGKYNAAENDPFEIILEDNTLFIQSGQLKFELFPASETEFFTREVDIRLKFTFDANNQMTSSTSFVGEREYPLKRIP